MGSPLRLAPVLPVLLLLLVLVLSAQAAAPGVAAAQALLAATASSLPRAAAALRRSELHAVAQARERLAEGGLSPDDADALVRAVLQGVQAKETAARLRARRFSLRRSDFAGPPARGSDDAATEEYLLASLVREADEAVEAMMAVLTAQPALLPVVDAALGSKEYALLARERFRAGDAIMTTRMMLEAQDRLDAALHEAESLKHAGSGGPLDEMEEVDAEMAHEYYVREPHSFLHFAFHQLGMHTEARAHAEAFLDYAPEDETMVANWHYYDEAQHEDERPDWDEDDVSDEATRLRRLASVSQASLRLHNGSLKYWGPSRVTEELGNAARLRLQMSSVEYDRMQLEDETADLHRALEDVLLQRADKQPSKLQQILAKADEAERAATAAGDDGARGASSADVANADGTSPFRVREVERRSNLSYEEFFREYSAKSKPVIITDAMPSLFANSPSPWSLEHIVDVCGDVYVHAQRYDPSVRAWGKLASEKVVKLRDFVAEFQANVTRVDDAHAFDYDGPKDVDGNPLLYLFDLPLPEACPEIVSEFTVPKYFAGDLLQRVPRDVDVPYRDAWPSLFIGPRYSRGSLHVDSFGSSFWMALFEGRKKWIFFEPEQKPLLYEQRADQTFAVDVFRPNLTETPMYARAVHTECVLQPGEILFVPAGSPHQVMNLDATVSVSMNFIDAANRQRVIDTLKNGERAGWAGVTSLRQTLMDPEFTWRMSRTQKDLAWDEFKTWPRPADEGPWVMGPDDDDEEGEQIDA